MSDIAIIQKATLYEMADAIIDTTERTESFKVSDMPTLIREDVYGAGYDKGYEEGAAGAEKSPRISGSFVWNKTPNFTRPKEYTRIYFPEGSAYTYFYEGSDYSYSEIECIEFGDEGIIYIYQRFSGETVLTAYDGGDIWHSYYYSEVFEFPDDTYRVIDIVANEFYIDINHYNLLMECFVRADEESCYDIGHSVGYKKGYDDGEKSANPVLYGTYIFAKNPTYSGRTTALTLDVSSGDIWAHFYYEAFSENMYQWVNKIIFGTDYFQVITYGDHDEEVSLDYTNANGWLSYIDAIPSEIKGENYRVIDFKEPLEVSQDAYDLFMSIVDNPDTTPYNIGYDGGKKAEYDKFWDAFQDYGNRRAYLYAFRGFDDTNFYPKYDIICTGSANYMFGASKVTDLKARLKECGVTLDTSGSGATTEVFAYNSNLTRVPTVSTISAPSVAYIFCQDSSLIEIEKLILKSDGSQSLNSAFVNCNKLTTLIIEGTIGKGDLNLQWSTKLSKNSIISVINALSTTTSGLSITLSLTAVNKAFESGLNYNDGATTQEFLALRNSRSNWSINLV